MSVDSECSFYLHVEQNSFYFHDGKKTIEIEAKDFPNFLKIIKAVITSDDDARNGKIIRLSKRWIAFFRKEKVQFASRNGSCDIFVQYDRFPDVCERVTQNWLTFQKFDAYEKMLL